MNLISHNKKLLGVKSKFVYSADQLDTLNATTIKKIYSDTLNYGTDTIKYLTGMIYVSCLQATSGCAQYIGDIKFSKDTIHLLAINASDSACTEREVLRIVYKIENKTDKKYFFKRR